MRTDERGTRNPEMVAVLGQARVLCVGDVMLDRFVYGHVERISPEAPIPVLRIDRDISMLGGAGNVVRNLVGLGADAEFISVVGKDAAGHQIMALVGELDGVEAHILSESSRETTLKTRYVAGGQQLLRADSETIAEIAPATSDDIVQIVAGCLARADVVVLSDYAKGVLNARTTEALIAAARNHGKPVVVDPKGGDYSRYKGATVLTPNRKELAEAVQAPTATNEEVARACRKLLKACMVEAVLCTRGAEGMTLVVEAGGVHHLPAIAREVFDVSGAGDTVVATVAAALAGGLPLLEAAHLATLASGIVVGKVGTAVAYADDVIRELRREDMAAREHKLATLDQAGDEAAKWRRQGLRIGFTSGRFDVLQPGHVSVLAQAKAACDRLVVGLSSDASIARLEGDSDAAQNEAARGTVLSSLATVDLVVTFDEDAPLALIEAVRPDVLVTGGDKHKDVVGGDLVRRWGGRVLLAKPGTGRSPGTTIKKIAWPRKLKRLPFPA